MAGKLAGFAQKLEKSIAADMEALSKLPQDYFNESSMIMMRNPQRQQLQKSIDVKRNRLKRYKELKSREAGSMNTLSNAATMDASSGMITKSGKAFSELTVGNKSLKYSLDVQAQSGIIHNDHLVAINNAVKEIMRTSEDTAVLFQRLAQLNESMPEEVQVNLNTINYVQVEPANVEYGPASRSSLLNK